MIGIASKLVVTLENRPTSTKLMVDDGLKSVEEPTEAVDLLRRTQALLATANLHLQKIASNLPEATQAFPIED